MAHTTAFLLSPTIPFTARQRILRTEHRWRPRKPLLQPAAVPCMQQSAPNDDDESSTPSIQSMQTRTTKEPELITSGEHHSTTDMDDFSEMDQIAEEWIGADLSRWEWYERMKGRRNKLLVSIEKREKDLDEDLEELRRTFMEVDAVFGTKMLDDESEVTWAGWSVIALSMALYIVVGYSLFEFFVSILTSLSPSFP